MFGNFSLILLIRRFYIYRSFRWFYSLYILFSDHYVILLIIPVVYFSMILHVLAIFQWFYSYDDSTYIDFFLMILLSLFFVYVSMILHIWQVFNDITFRMILHIWQFFDDFTLSIAPWFYFWRSFPMMSPWHLFRDLAHSSTVYVFALDICFSRALIFADTVLIRFLPLRVYVCTRRLTTLAPRRPNVNI